MKGEEKLKWLPKMSEALKDPVFETEIHPSKIGVILNTIFDIPKNVITDDKIGICSRSAYLRGENVMKSGREVGEVGRPSLLNYNIKYI
jgi:hypothetical protein